MLKKELYQQLLEANGRFVQCLKAIEEAGEFSSALAKLMGESKGIVKLIEETADLKIMIEQIEFMFGIEEEIQSAMNMKLARQEVRLYEQNKSN